MKILITGSAGFIGSNLVLRLLNTESPIDIIGLDSLNARANECSAKLA